MLEFSIVTISVFVSTLNEITKAIVKGVFKKEINKFIPLFSITYGIVLAIIAFYTGIENFGNNLIEAIFIGLSSGAAAVGYHQVGKQLLKPAVTTTDTSTQQTSDIEQIEDVTIPDETVEDATVDEPENPEVEDVKPVTYDDEIDLEDDYVSDDET